jgi:outer membrane protein OmpA-like peptidoglycan-associated protein
MPNAINPNDYNIDFFATDFIGVTTAESFRDYLFSKNLPDLPPELINGAAGNFSSDYAEKGLEKSINYTSISNPGDIDEWLVEGNFSTSLHEVRDINLLSGNNYGPPTIEAYNEPGLIPENTGFLQYPTSSGGDDLKSILLSDQLAGLGPGAAINFPSDLNDIAKDRRKEEAINRLKLKAQDNILGKLNLDPFGLLAGEDLILRDYKITTRPTVLGKVFEFFSDAADVTIPNSPIPSGAFGSYGDLDNPVSYSDLMDSTGSGTKTLIYNAVARNKYGPTLSEPKGFLANTFGAGQAAQKNNYLSPASTTLGQTLGIPLIDKINQAVGKAVDALNGGVNNGVGIEGNTPPTETENPSITLDNIQENAQAEFDTLWNGQNIDTWQTQGPITKIEIPGIGLSLTIPDNGPDGPIGTKIPMNVGDEFYPGEINGSKNSGISYDRGMYWGSHTNNPFKKGILKYTQDLINNSRNTKDYKDKARFVGATNDASNFDAKSGRHNNYSMGNTVTDAENNFYCRSWSVRNPYRKVSDLIRHGGGVDSSGNTRSLTREDLNLSVLDNNGFVKIAPYVGDFKSRSFSTDGSENNLESGVLKLGNPQIQKYMLSIENLAWQNSEHILHVAPCEVGPNGGRIMWFPPYDISFTDNSSANWEATSFIGRGEPVYTYNNTERSGTLSFTLIIDHSMAMTEIKQKGEEALFRYFAGCENPIEAFTSIVPKAVEDETKVQQVTETTTTKTDVTKDNPEVCDPEPPPVTKLQFYFRNARRFELDSVGTNLTTELGSNADEKPPNYLSQYTKLWPNGYLRGSSGTPPPTIPNPNNPGQFIPNPAFTSSTQTDIETLNQQALDNLNTLVDFLLTPDGKRYKIKIIGKTSDAGPTSGGKSNEKLAQKRANSTKDYLLNTLYAVETAVGVVKAENLGSQKTYPTEKEWRDSNLRWEVLAVGETDSSLSVSYDDGTGQKTEQKDDNRTFGDSQTSVPQAIRNRTTLVTLEYNKEIDDTLIGAAQPPITEQTEQTVVTVRDVETTIPASKEKIERQREAELAAALAAKASRYMAWECSYFEKMKQDDSFIYETLTQKLKYFHPAFHSMTPEGFNARLTFLKQCTRQGPNIAVGEPSNLAFGKPPVCVLRIGDFYHTKIIIDSVNLTFDPLQWDLNPEGIGVQPMLCKADLSFKFIGGSSLGGPISQLQNAVGFNFFANTALYNPRVISKSVGKYVTKRVDPLTGQETEFTVQTPAGANGSIEYGAFMTPRQSTSTSLSNNDSNGSTSNSSTDTVPNDKAKATADAQQADQQVAGKEAQSTVAEQTKVDQEFTKKEEEIADSSTAENDGVKGNTFPGFDKKTGVYTMQYTQILTWKKGGGTNAAPAGVNKLKVEKGQKVYLQTTTNGKEIFIGGSFKNPDNNKVYSTINNPLRVYCNGDNGFNFFFVESSGNSGFYTNTGFYNVVKKVFCKGTVPKTWAELTA